jgi:hypothetical protein
MGCRLKFLIYAAAILLSFAALIFGYLAVAMAEPDDLPLDGWTTRLFVPAAVHQLPTDGACGPITVSRNWLECGGICGVAYDVTFPSTNTVEAINARLGRYFGAALPDHTISVREASDAGSGKCRKVLVEIIKDSRYTN